MVKDSPASASTDVSGGAPPLADPVHTGKAIKGKLPDPRGQSLMTKFFNVISGADKVKHFASLFEKFEWERKERQRKEEERLQKIVEELRQKRIEERRILKLQQKKKREEEQRIREELYRKSMEGKQILGGLFLGNAKAAGNEEWMQANNVKYVLNVSREVNNYFEETGEVTYKRIHISDDRDADITEHFNDALAFIDVARKSSNSILVHCREGKSRSPTIIIAYVMKYCKMDLAKAYKDVFAKNGSLRINDGFKKKLMDYELSLFDKMSLDFFAKKGRKLGLTEMEVEVDAEMESEPTIDEDEVLAPIDDIDAEVNQADMDEIENEIKKEMSELQSKVRGEIDEEMKEYTITVGEDGGSENDVEKETEKEQEDAKQKGVTTVKTDDKIADVKDKPPKRGRGKKASAKKEATVTDTPSNSAKKEESTPRKRLRRGEIEDTEEDEDTNRKRLRSEEGEKDEEEVEGKRPRRGRKAKEPVVSEEKKATPIRRSTRRKAVDDEEDMTTDVVDDTPAADTTYSTATTTPTQPLPLPSNSSTSSTPSASSAFTAPTSTPAYDAPMADAPPALITQSPHKDKKKKKDPAVLTAKPDAEVKPPKESKETQKDEKKDDAIVKNADQEEKAEVKEDKPNVDAKSATPKKNKQPATKNSPAKQPATKNSPAKQPSNTPKNGKLPSGLGNLNKYFKAS